MSSVAIQSPPVNAMSVTTILKRGIGIRRAMEALAKWDYDRRSLPFESLKRLPADEQASYRQAVERLLEAFEEAVFDKEPESRVKARETERDAFLLMERQRARLEALQLGHELGGWYGVDGRLDETAACVRCRRAACLIVSYGPELDIRREGSALTEPCLVLTTAPTAESIGAGGDR